MSLQDDVLKAYHRAIARHVERTGECYPVVRASCVHDDGTITDTNVHWPETVARWNFGPYGRIIVRLVSVPTGAAKASLPPQQPTNDR